MPRPHCLAAASLTLPVLGFEPNVSDNVIRADMCGYPKLIEGLLRRDHSETEIRKFLGGNVLPVWAAGEAHARQAHGRR